MAFDPHMPQRVAIVIEQNKSGTWSVASYLITVSGSRERRRIAVKDSYPEAAEALKQAWASLEPDCQT